MLVDPGQKAYTQSMPAKAQLKLVRICDKNTRFSMHKLALSIVSFLTGFFVCEFIISLFLKEDKIPLE